MRDLLEAGDQAPLPVDHQLDGDERAAHALLHQQRLVAAGCRPAAGAARPRRPRAERSSARSPARAGFTTTGHAEAVPGKLARSALEHARWGVETRRRGGVLQAGLVAHRCEHLASGEGQHDAVPPRADEHHVDRLLAARVDDRAGRIRRPAPRSGPRAGGGGDHARRQRRAPPCGETTGRGSSRTAPAPCTRRPPRPRPRIPATAAFRCASGTSASISGWGRRDAFARARAVDAVVVQRALEGAEAMLRASWTETLMGDPTALFGKL